MVVARGVQRKNWASTGTNKEEPRMNITGIEEHAIVLNFTPLELDHTDKWEKPRTFSKVFSLSYLCPVAYNVGDVSLQETLSLQHAIGIATSCQSFDGGGAVWSIAVERKGGRKVGEDNPWGKPPDPEALTPELVPVEVSNGR